MTQNDPETPAPFAPFLPAGQPTGPVHSEPKPSRRKTRKKPSPAKTEPVRAAAPVAPPAPRQRRRKAAEPKSKRAPRYDLQTILKVAAALKDGDQKVFEKLLGELSALAKGSRERVLKALGEVFS